MAADWLGDVGDAAMGFVSRAFQWSYFRSTGDVWSISQRTIGLAPSLRWVLTGRGERRVGPDISDAFAQGVRQAEEAWSERLKAEQGRATPPVASAAATVPESHTSGAVASWRWLEHEVAAHAEPEQPVKPPHNADQVALAEALERAKAVLHEAATHTATNTAEVEAERFAREIDAERRRLAAHVPDIAPPVCPVCRGEYSATYCEPCRNTGVVQGVDLGARTSETGATVLVRDPDGVLRHTATFEGPDAEQQARDFIAGLPLPDAPSPLSSSPSDGAAGHEPGCGADSGERGRSLVCTAHFRGEHLATGVGGRVYRRWPIDPETPAECGAVDAVFGPGLGPVCTRPPHSDGLHEAVDHVTGRHVSSWSDMPETPDPRWEPGATWEHNGKCYPLSLALPTDRPEWVRFVGLLADVRVSDMTEANGWRFVPAKPSQVKPGQAWRCVGIDGELEVHYLRREDDPRDVGLRRLGTSGVSVRARAADMLGLKEWSFVRGPR